MESTVNNTFTTTSEYSLVTETLQVSIENSFNSSPTYQIETSAVGVPTDNTFTCSPTYFLETVGFNERLIRLKRATSFDIKKNRSFSNIRKRLSIIQTIKGLKASPFSCGSVRACASLNRKTATVVDIRKNVISFTSQEFYKTTASFTPSLNTDLYVRKDVDNTFTTTSNYQVEGTFQQKLNTPFTTSVQYSLTYLEGVKFVSNTFTTNSLYTLVGQKEVSPENTFTTQPKYDFFTESAIVKTSNTFTTSSTYDVNTISLFQDVGASLSTQSAYDFKSLIDFLNISNTFTTQPKYDFFTESAIVKVDNTFTTNSNYAVETISIFLGIGKSFNTSVAYDLKTFFDQTQVDNMFTTTTNYVLETISEFKDVANTFSTQGVYAIDTLSVFKQTQENFTTTSSYDLQTIADTTQVSNTFTTTSQYIVNAVTKIEYLTSASFTPSFSSVTIDTFYAQPNEDVSINYNEWFRSDQDQVENLHYELLRGITPNDSEYLETTSGPNNITALFGLDSSAGPYENNDQLHQLKVRSRGVGTLGSVDLGIVLYSGTTSILSTNLTNRPSSFSTNIINLSSFQVNQLNYGNLRVELIANTTDGSNKRIEVSWVQLVIPEVEQ